MQDILLSSGIVVKVKQVPNITIYNEVAKHKLKVPQPPIVTLDDGRETENTFSPVYQEAISIFQLQQNNLAFDVILNHAVSIDERLLQDKKWKRQKELLEKNKLLSYHEKEFVAFLKYYALAENFIDRNHLTQNAILHEGLVYDIFNSLIVTRDGYNIHETNLRNAVHVGIEVQPLIVEGCQLVTPVDELNACKENNIDWLKWYQCEVTLQEKAVIIGLHRLNSVIKSHQEDIIQIESEKKNKKKG